MSTTSPPYSAQQSRRYVQPSPSRGLPRPRGSWSRPTAAEEYAPRIPQRSEPRWKRPPSTTNTT
eukprot:2309728-Pyramimonas_sp.AAC.1